MPRKEATCKKCHKPLKGHLNKKICPDEHGHHITEEGKFTCSDTNCSATFTTLYAARKHSTSSSCEYYKGPEQPHIHCSNNCGKVFTGSGARGNASTHATSTMCPKHPNRINNPNYRTTIKHIIDSNNMAYCNHCKTTLPIEQFADKPNAKNDTKLDYVCYKCRSCLAMRQGAINRAKSEGNCSDDLSVEYIRSLIVDNCPVLGIPLQYGGAEQCDNSATIDAFDHEKGHIKGNLRIISKKANVIKNDSTPEEMNLLLTALKGWEAPIVNDNNNPKRAKGSKTIDGQSTKCCSLCGEEKSLNLFHKSKSATQIGISNRCIKCSALSSMIKNAKQRCKTSGRELDIDVHYLYNLTIGHTKCPILGIELVYGGTVSIKNNSASIDRFDTTKGYTKDNVWIISYKANRMKSDATIDEIEKVYQYMTSVLV